MDGSRGVTWATDRRLVSRTINPPLSLQRVSDDDRRPCRRCVTCISICYRRYAAHIASTSAQPRARLRGLQTHESRPGQQNPIR